jgi:type I restriction enzyme M protein
MFETDIALVYNDLLESLVDLPTKLVLKTQIFDCLWFLWRGKTVWEKEVLLIDVRNLGHLLNRRNRQVRDEGVALIVDTYHAWRQSSESGFEVLEDYQDMLGFCKSTTTIEIADLNYVITPGRYVGLTDDEDDFDFAERFAALKTVLEGQNQPKGTRFDGMKNETKTRVYN